MPGDSRSATERAVQDFLCEMLDKAFAGRGKANMGPENIDRLEQSEVARMERESEKDFKRDGENRANTTAGIPLSRLEAICQAERDGRCVVLPCKVGDKVSATVLRPYNGHEAYIHGETTGFVITDKILFRVVYNQCRFIDFHAEDFGKTVFLTRAAAESAMNAGREAETK